MPRSLNTSGSDTPTNTSRPNRDRSRKRPVGLVVTVASCFALAACSGGSDADTFTVAFIEPDLTSVPLMAAVDTLREDGHSVETIELAEPELAIEGLANGTYAISAEATSPALVAMERGAPIKIIADVVGNQWAMYAQESITSCDDLAGRPVGIFSEGAVATAMVREWVEQECTSGTPEYLVIGGSDVRAQALLADEIDATALEISDVVTLQMTTDVDFTLLVDFGDVLSHLHPQTVYANTDFLESNPEAAQAFVTALIAEHEKINADPAYLVELAGTYLDEEPSDTLQAIAEAYVNGGLFDAGGLTQEGVQGTLEFFIDAGVISDLDVETAADLSFLNES